MTGFCTRAPPIVYACLGKGLPFESRIPRITSCGLELELSKFPTELPQTLGPGSLVCFPILLFSRLIPFLLFARVIIHPPRSNQEIYYCDKMRDNVDETKKRKRETCNAQTEKKRELDRIAQKKSRERARNRMQELEGKLKRLQADDKQKQITDLMQVVEDLRTENERLRSVTDKIRYLTESAGSTAVGPTVKGTSFREARSCRSYDSCTRGIKANNCLKFKNQLRNQIKR